MTFRIAIVGIIVEQPENAAKVNHLLSGCRRYIVGRMGVPLARRDANVISVVLDAPADEVNALAGKLSASPGVSAKAVFSRQVFEDLDEYSKEGDI